ncbi:large ribosomal subunit protein uL1 [Rhipicephalus microplus]|uniref:large ribosomal subunit protein uL1 n=1 Tax=Rhipicephalus microplus TaxID=6941 RepID=UPI003F6C779A
MDNPTPSTVDESSDSEKILKAVAEKLRNCIEQVLRASQEKPRRFVETVELQIKLRNYNARKDECLRGDIRLPHIPRKKLAVCVIGNKAQCDEAKSHQLSAVPDEILKGKTKKGQTMKKIVEKYRVFMATEPVIKKIPRNIANDMVKKGKLPVVLGEEEPMQAKLEEVRTTVTFRVKAPLIGVPVGNVSMTPEELGENINIVIKHILATLEQHKLVVRSMHTKSTMGPPQKLY